jgi:hypothetical protein
MGEARKYSLPSVWQMCGTVEITWREKNAGIVLLGLAYVAECWSAEFRRHEEFQKKITSDEAAADEEVDEPTHDEGNVIVGWFVDSEFAR